MSKKKTNPPAAAPGDIPIQVGNIEVLTLQLLNEINKNLKILISLTVKNGRQSGN